MHSALSLPRYINPFWKQWSQDVRVRHLLLQLRYLLWRAEAGGHLQFRWGECGLSGLRVLQPNQNRYRHREGSSVGRAHPVGKVCLFGENVVVLGSSRPGVRVQVPQAISCSTGSSNPFSLHPLRLPSLRPLQLTACERCCRSVEAVVKSPMTLGQKISDWIPDLC